MNVFFNWIGFLKGDEYLDESRLPFPTDLNGRVLEPIPEESTIESIVYEVNIPALGIDKAWVNRTTGLLEKQVGTDRTTSSSSSGGVTRIKKGTVQNGLIFDYEPIPDEMFAMTVPDDFVEWYVPISGTVLNEDGSPAIGATLYLGGSVGHSSSTVADADGKWQLKILPTMTEPTKTALFPVGVWATKRNDPNWVAWTVITDPDEERELAGTIPGEVNEIDVLDDNGFNRFAGATEVTLHMQLAGAITGRVTDQDNRAC